MSMPGRTVLVIDYDPQSIESTRKSLVDAGYQVEVATDGVEGLKTFERACPDLVLIEPMVPKKHGFQVCREIKGSARGRATPVLITTAFYKGRKHRAQARENYGCDDYLEKPIAQGELLAACRRWVDDRGALDVPARPTSGSISFALDDLSDDEIVARLDAMIDKATALPEPEPRAIAEPAPVVPPRPVAAPAPAPIQAVIPVAKASAPRPPVRSSAAVRPEPRARSAEAAVLASGTTRAVVARAAVEPRRSPRAIYAVLAVVGLAALGAAAWIFARPGTEPAQAIAEAPRPQAPTQRRSLPTELPATESRAPLNVRPERVATPPVFSPAPSSAPAPTPALPSEPTSARPPKRPRPSSEPAPTPSASAEPAATEPAANDPLADPVVPVGPADLPELAPAPVDESAETERPAVELGSLVDLSEVDSAPVPIRKDAPVYPPMARSLRQHGTVILRVLVDESGGVERAEVSQGIDGRLLDGAALRAVKSWRYRPGMEDGVRVKVWITERVVFRL
jgi:periplasmic protein TonB